MSYSKIIETLAVTTDASSLELEVEHGACIAYIEVKNTASVALSSFKLYRRATPQSSYELLAEVAGDYITPLMPIMETSGSPITLGASAEWFCRLDVKGCSGLKIVATVASNATSLGVRVNYYSNEG